MMSSDGTPGYPAPDTACIVVTMTDRRPNCRSGASAIDSTTVEQFGLVTIAPRPAAFAPLCGEKSQVIGIDFGYQQRHERIHAVAAGVADDDVPGLGERRFDVLGRGRIER